MIGLYVARRLASLGVTHDEFMGIDLSGDKHSTITFEQLRNYEQCESIHLFADVNALKWMERALKAALLFRGKKKASTLSLTVLVVIEMLNALNALSETVSRHATLINPWLLAAMLVWPALSDPLCGQFGSDIQHRSLEL